MKPRFGDGVDVVITPANVAESVLRDNARPVFKSTGQVPENARRAFVMIEPGAFDLSGAVSKAIDVLSRNPKGFFLMVEMDAHTSNLQAGLDNVLTLDRVIQATAARMKSDTLIIFSADHSFDTRLRGGKKGKPLLSTPEATAPAGKPNVRVDNGHTGEDVVVAVQGPGSEKVQGFFSNTQLFRIMMAAYGWD